ncbi:MAG: ribonuclease R [Fusobacteriaceae bacterium]|jgi:ribonuclease R|nr:ribonuclease R [Fusobacteriaceae bacterium]
MESERELEKLKTVLSQEGRGLKYDELVSLCNWQELPKKEVKGALREWIAAGEITVNKKNRYNIPDMHNVRKGVVSMTTDRYGFVDTEEGGIFVPGGDLKNAVDGDVVHVRILPAGEDGKRQGKIVRVLKRNKNTVIGIFKQSGDFAFVMPTGSFGRDIYISTHMMQNAKDNDLVSVEIVDWGNEVKKPSGKILRILGDAADTENLIEALLVNEGLTEAFPEDALKEARSIPAGVTAEERKGRADLTKLPIITIDGDDAKDLDDAVYVEKLSNGNFKLIVSIADVSHYVKEGSPLDNEAFRRGNSVYLVDRVLPMLPRELSNGICSLNEGEEKLTFSCRMEIGPDGEVEDYDIYKSVIRSARRMTYRNVNRLLSGEEEYPADCGNLREMLGNMVELSRILQKKKHKRGNIDFDIPEIKVTLDDEGKVEKIETRERGEAERLIEDFMVAANETIAEDLYYSDIPAVYRTHEKPEEERLTELNRILRKFGYRVSSADKVHPRQFQEVIEKSREEGVNPLIHKLILMSLKQAQYTVENMGHFGLASKCYTHFTSPIRRYADLLVHRILTGRLCRASGTRDAVRDRRSLPDVCLHISQTERVAMRAEFESIRIKTVEYMSGRIGEEFTGVIVGFTKKKIFFNTEEGVECYWDLVEADHYYELDEDNYVMVDRNGPDRFHIGDRQSITVVRTDIVHLEVEVVPSRFLPGN